MSQAGTVDDDVHTPERVAGSNLLEHGLDVFLFGDVASQGRQTAPLTLQLHSQHLKHSINNNNNNNNNNNDQILTIIIIKIMIILIIIL